MTTDRPIEYLVGLVRELCKLPQETEWAEFKVNEAEPQNSAAASRLIREAVEAGRVLPYDSGAAPKLMRYVLFWAKPKQDVGT